MSVPAAPGSDATAADPVPAARQEPTVAKVAERGGCPVVTYDIMSPRPVLTGVREMAELREAAPVCWNDFGTGFWMLTRYDECREAYQNPDIFGSDSVIPLDPNPGYHWIPTHVASPEHSWYRQILNPPFSPRAVNALVPRMRELCDQTIDMFVDAGGCEFVNDFAAVYSTRVFLSLLGLPAADDGLFAEWVDTVFAGFTDPEGQARTLAAVTAMMEYFVTLVADRRAARRDPEGDFVSYLMTARFGDRPLRDDEILQMCVVLVLAGLDTVKSQLSYAFHHLATTPAHRHRISIDPSVLPSAVEEFLRAFPIIQDGRKLTRDVDFHGCPMKKGDMVQLTLGSAMRDPRVFPNPDDVDLDREANRHFSFAAGPHRCLGAHLARAEMTVALEVWHSRIPDYRLADDGPVLERGGAAGLVDLQLAWDTAG
ncbi:cytochrome P450 [Pseudofrankia saprophytica]|uniref:cytochrome P450 n=1 Tax=Pseudofrankia saprophytica TaxID=298655 RepID=UPI000234D830|nr:cytochrome P450 [Pseudofrankia saprophytica]